MTRAVTEASPERHKRLHSRNHKASVKEPLAIANRASAQVKRPYLDHAELLFDEHRLRK